MRFVIQAASASQKFLVMLTLQRRLAILVKALVRPVIIARMAVSRTLKLVFVIPRFVATAISILRLAKRIRPSAPADTIVTRIKIALAKLKSA